jgi:hypothetical protein
MAFIAAATTLTGHDESDRARQDTANVPRSPVHLVTLAGRLDRQIGPHYSAGGSPKGVVFGHRFLAAQASLCITFSPPRATRVIVGEVWGCATKNESLRCLGDDSLGQLGGSWGPVMATAIDVLVALLLQALRQPLRRKEIASATPSSARDRSAGGSP